MQSFKQGPQNWPSSLNKSGSGGLAIIISYTTEDDDKGRFPIIRFVVFLLLFIVLGAKKECESVICVILCEMLFAILLAFCGRTEYWYSFTRDLSFG